MTIAVLGGGVAGLGAAKKLAEAGKEVLLLEKDGILGGLASSFEMQNYQMPKYYHHLMKNEAEIIKLLKEFGMDVIWKKTKMGIDNGQKTYHISYVSAIFWDFLSISDKVRFGLLQLRMKMKKSWKELEGKNAKEWLEQTAGKNVTEKIFEPLMFLKYGTGLDRISASELAERLGANEATGTLGYPKGGWQRMYDKLGESIEKKGGIVKKNCEVTKIATDGMEVKSVEWTEGGKKREQQVSQIINTLPVPEFIKMTEKLPTAYAERLSKIKYCKSICVDMGYREPLSDYYWINCFNREYGGVIEHTNLYDAYPFKMSYVFKYAPSEELWNSSNERIAERFLSEARKMFPRFRGAEWVKVMKAEYASPIYDIDYSKVMPSCETPIKGMYHAGMSVIYPELRDQNSPLKSGYRAAELLLASE